MGWTLYFEVTSCLLSSTVSLFDHLHDCYVEYTQNYTDKSFDKVCCPSHLETSRVHAFILIQVCI